MTQHYILLDFLVSIINYVKLIWIQIKNMKTTWYVVFVSSFWAKRNPSFGGTGKRLTGRIFGSRKDREDCSRRGRKDINVVETHCRAPLEDTICRDRLEFWVSGLEFWGFERSEIPANWKGYGFFISRLVD